MRIERVGDIGPLFKIKSDGTSVGTHVFAPNGVELHDGIERISLDLEAPGIMRATLVVRAEVEADFIAHLQRQGVVVDDDGDVERA